jgi:type I restriction enzyme, R subunit
VKSTVTRVRPQEELDLAIRQVIAGAIAPEGVVDIFAAAGMEKPNLSLLSEEFLSEVRELPQRNLAVELLEKLLNDEIKVRTRTNLVQSPPVLRDARGIHPPVPGPGRSLQRR